MAEPSLTALRATASLVDGAVRRSIKRRGHPRDLSGLYRLRDDVRRRLPDADMRPALTVHGDLIVFLDGRDLRDLLPKAHLPEPGTASHDRWIAEGRADLRVRRSRRGRIARRPVCARPRRRESRPRARRRRSPRATRAGPSDPDSSSEPGEPASPPPAVGLTVAGAAS